MGKNSELFLQEREHEDYIQDEFFLQENDWEEERKLSKYLKKRHPRLIKRKEKERNYKLPFDKRKYD